MSTRIENCKFTFKCPRTWEQLDQTDDDHVRFCGACAKQVHLCNTHESLLKHARDGHCVAIRQENDLPYGTSVTRQGNRQTEDLKVNFATVGRVEPDPPYMSGSSTGQPRSDRTNPSTRSEQ